MSVNARVSVRLSVLPLRRALRPGQRECVSARVSLRLSVLPLRRALRPGLCVSV